MFRVLLRSGSALRKLGLAINFLLFSIVAVLSGLPLALVGIFLAFPAAMALVHRVEVSWWVAWPVVATMWKIQPAWGRSFLPAFFLTVLVTTGYGFASNAIPAELVLVVTASIAATYAAGKFGCIALGCCRSRDAPDAKFPLPVREALTAEIIFGCMTLALAFAGRAEAIVAACGLAGLALLRRYSLLRRQAPRLAGA